MDSDVHGILPTRGTSRMTQGLCLAAFVVTAIALVGITLTLVPSASRSGWFWLRLVWMVFLSALCWGSVSGFLWSSLFAGLSLKGGGGVAPSILMVVFWYSVVSAGLMVVQAILSWIEWVWRVHLAVQIGMSAIVAVILLFMLVPLLPTGKNEQRSNSEE